MIPDDITEKTRLSPKIERKRLKPVDNSVEVQTAIKESSKKMKAPKEMSKTFNITPVKRKWLY